MAAPSYIRNGSMYVPAVALGSVNHPAGPVADLHGNFNITTGATGALIQDLVVLPAGLLDSAGQWIEVWVQITVVNNANTKTVSLNWGGTGAIAGAVSGGTTLASVAGTTITNMLIRAHVMKTGASTQDLSAMTVSSATVALSDTTSAQNDQAKIQLNLVLNAATAASDISGVNWGVTFHG